MNTAEKTSAVDYLIPLERCYRESAPSGGVLEEDITPEERDMYDDMVEQGLLRVVVRLNGDKIYTITDKGAILLPLPVLQDCLQTTAQSWIDIVKTSNIRPIYYGPFYTRVEYARSNKI